MPLTDYVTLGRSGLRVSPLCLGTMTFGEDWGWGSTPTEAAAVLGRYLARGGNFIDTANVYTKGHSEAIIGEAIGSNRARRDRIVIATKFFGNLYPGDPNAGGAGRKSLTAACEQSLRRLKTDYIDLYWMHCWDHHTPIDETMRALDDLVRAGKIRYVGFSDTPAWKVVEAQMLARFHGMGARDGDSDFVLARRADGRRRPDADGAGVRARRDPVVAARRRRADWKIHAGERDDGRPRRARDVGTDGAELRHRGRARPHRPRSQHDARPRSPSPGCRRSPA